MVVCGRTVVVVAADTAFGSSVVVTADAAFGCSVVVDAADIFFDHSVVVVTFIDFDCSFVVVEKSKHFKPNPNVSTHTITNDVNKRKYIILLIFDGFIPMYS